MNRSQRILLKPTVAQRNLFAGAAGLSRFAWNWALNFRQRHYEWFGKLPGYKPLTVYTLRKHWNKVKDRQFPWVRGYSIFAPEQSFFKLDQAYTRAFARMAMGQNPGFPRFHKKGDRESFQVVPDRHHPMKRVGSRFFVPRIGLVKCQTKLRWPNAKQVSGRIKLVAGRWWLMLSYDLLDAEILPVDRPTCGVDLGCKTLATVVSGGELVESVQPLKPYAKAKRKLRRLGRVVSRRFVKGKRQSARYRRAKLALAKQHERIASLRSNYLHQFTSRIVKRYGVVVLEDLNVKGLAGGMLAGTIQDLGFAELRRQVEYKADAVGTKVVLADRFYPSSKTCSSCDRVKAKLSLSDRVYVCECGLSIDRDVNAALNLEKLGRGTPKDTPVEIGDQVRRKPIRCRSRKQVRTESPIGD